MRALKLVAPKKVELSQVDAPSNPAPQEVFIDVKYCGICGTDMHIFAGHRSDVALPRIMGHEFVGIVQAVGADISHVAPGDAVVVDPVVACGTCHTCQSGHPNVCSAVACLGVQTDGCLQDTFVAQGASVYKVSGKLPLEYYATAEPYSIAANVLSKFTVTEDEVCVIFGAGTIGLCIAQALSSRCKNIISIDMVDQKLVYAKEFGAMHTINSKNTTAYDAVMELTQGRGANVIIDAVGLAGIMNQAVDMAAPCARIINLGFDANPTSIKPVDLTKREISIIGSRMNCFKMNQVIEWMETGVLDPKLLIEKIVDIEDAQQAFEDTIDPAQNLRKVLLRF